MNAPEFTPAERDRIEERMRNWARWAIQSNGPGYGQCASAEHMYVAPKEADDVGAERIARETDTIDIRDACRIEDAITRMKPSHQAFLRAWYVYRAHPKAMARTFNVGQWALVPTLWVLLGRMTRHLEQLASRPQIRYKTSTIFVTPQQQEA